MILAIQLVCRDEVIACYTQDGSDPDRWRWVDGKGDLIDSPEWQRACNMIAGAGQPVSLVWMDGRVLDDVSVCALFI